MMQALLEYWSDMFKWNYTATRKQYWIPTIVYSILYNILFYSTGIAVTGFSYIDFSTTNSFVAALGVVFFIAQFTLTTRRLHDTNRSAAWILLGLIPVIGWIALIVILCQPTRTYENRTFATYLNQSTR
ncbi:DUF805 domain-containing protein [Enterococcus hermanniensis]|uniref:DUF805 domain-containing protein n=1 Tax=Enterococcus hermanniensis TaxID=249189 RepID=A0A1L8TPN9_9ENTE|nr:DUF805 domain-containing protein [Enterococcus hermanniensis]OJG46289.1 hypothetical protein RV04_GL001455 [Enterococcus hermanniensis]